MEFFRFDTEQKAQEFINKINIGENIPKFPDSLTTTYCDYVEENGEYLVIKDNVTSKYYKKEFSWYNPLTWFN